MKKEIIQELKDNFDDVSIKGNTVTVRRAFFYTFGQSEVDLENKVKSLYPNAQIIDSGVKNYAKPFRGGASVKQSPHWWVTFRL